MDAVDVDIFTPAFVSLAFHADILYISIAIFSRCALFVACGLNPAEKHSTFSGAKLSEEGNSQVDPQESSSALGRQYVPDALKDQPFDKT